MTAVVAEVPRYELAPNFYLDEFDCHDGTPVPSGLIPNLEDLARNVLRPIREAWGAPIIIVSGYRTNGHNKRVGGALTSTHLTGDGCDIRTVRQVDVQRLYALIEMLHGQGKLSALGGLGKYPGWVHVDTRQVGHLRRWGGSGFGSEPR